MREPYELLTAEIIRLEEAAAAAKDAASIAAHNLVTAERALIAAIEAGSVPEKFTAHGFTWSRSIATFVRPSDGEATQRVVDWIADHGGESLVKQTMHPGSRDKFLREVLLDDDGVASIPDELLGLVKVDEIDRVSKRRVIT